MSEQYGAKKEEQLNFKGDLGGDMQPPITDDEDDVSPYIPGMAYPMEEEKEVHNFSGYEGDADRGMSAGMSKFQRRKTEKAMRQEM